MMRFFLDTLDKLRRDQRGNVMMLFGAAVVPLLLISGGAVDLARYTRYRSDLANGVDAAALALARDTSKYKTECTTVGQVCTTATTFVQNYINSLNIADDKFEIHGVSAQRAANGFEVDAIGTMNTIFLPLGSFYNSGGGVMSMGASISAQVVSESKRLEVALVLDNSGSMSGSKITTLKTAAVDLTEDLFALGDNSTLTDPVKIAVVPFAGSVNVGSQYASATWMDTGAKGTYHADAMEANGAPATTNNFTLFNSLRTPGGSNMTWGGCVEARPMPYDVTDDVPSTAANPTAEQKKTLFVPMFAPDEPDSWTCEEDDCEHRGKSSDDSIRYNDAPDGDQNYNNYLPDAGNGTAAGCSANTVNWQTFTVTRASPAVFTRNNHGLRAGDQIFLKTTGTLYSPLDDDEDDAYYVISAGLTANRFRVSTSPGGSAVNTSGSQSGTHSYSTYANWTCEDGSTNCGGGTGSSIGRSEQTALAGMSVPTSSLCKYGTAANKATIADIDVGGIPGGPNFMCTTAPILPLSTNQATVTTKINGLNVQGATSVVEGAAWGWRVLSPTAPFTEASAYDITETKKILVLMTDGRNTYYPKSSKFVLSWYQQYGYVGMNHLGTTSTDQATLSAAMDVRTTTACTNIKAAGIIIYTVGFDISGEDADDVAARAVLENCASEPDYFHEAEDNAELVAAFDAIGDSIRNLHIAR
jgi:Flp pilus assembly protein TadG